MTPGTVKAKGAARARLLSRAAFAAVLLGGVLLGADAEAETRIALVIGNGAYAHAPRLTNPEHDADAIAASLRKAGFAVDERKDLKSDDLRLAVLTFSKQAENADVAVVYYAGHGIQAAGVNYLIPVDAVLASPGSLSLEAMPADAVLGAVSLAHHLRLLILDACRDNPFKDALASAGTRAVAARGLAPIATDGVSDTLVAYSAMENTVALDGVGLNSPFAESLAQRIDEKGTELDKMFREVRDDVIAATNGNQTPFVYGSRGSNDFYFMPGGTVISGTVVNSIAATPAGVDPLTVELAYWDSIKASNDPADFNAYLKKYPQGQFTAIANNRLASLASPQSAPAQRSLAAPSNTRLNAQVAQVTDVAEGVVTQAHDNAAEARSQRSAAELAETHAEQAAAKARDAAAKAKAGGAGYTTYASNGGTYTGEGTDKLSNGAGIFDVAGKEHHEGEWKNGVASGAGVDTFTDGNRYEAEYQNGKRNGLGVAIFASGLRYEGEFKNDYKDGFGVYLYKDGDRYEGEFRQDANDGVGTYYGAGTRTYLEKAGQFTDGKLNGYAAILWRDGQRWIGEFRDDALNGYGAKLDAENRVLEQGLYAAGKLQTAAAQ